jgi:hypothetical protein
VNPMTGQSLYETYLADRGWSMATPWGALEAYRKLAWDEAAEGLAALGVPAAQAVRIYVWLLRAVSLAP